MIDKETQQKIFDAANIHDVVSDFVNLTKRGSNYVGLCPFHNEKTGSFTVSPSKNIYKCFGCGESGGPVQFIMSHEKLSYHEALLYLAKKFHIDVVEKQLTPEELAVRSKEEAMYNVNEWANHYFEEQLYNTPNGKALGYSYFVERGFSEMTMKKFNLGYCQDEYHAFYDAAKQKGFKEEHLLATGLVTKNEKGYYADKFRGRVIFPIHSVSGRIVGFGGRILTAKSSQLAKYLNSPESEIYQKRRILYGLYQAKNSICKNDCCYLVEGYTDVISMHQSGVENVVASSGTSLTEEQIRLIHRFTNNITVLYDGDFAGIKASLRGIDMLLKEGMNIKVLLLPDGEDPDSFARSHNAVDFVNYINENQEDFIRFKIKILLKDVNNDPFKRAEAINNIVDTISLISDLVIREVYIKEASALLNVTETVLVRQVAQKRRERYAKDKSVASNPRSISENSDNQNNSNNGKYTSESTANTANTVNTANTAVDNTPNASPTKSEAPASTIPVVSNNDKYFISEKNIIHYLICYPKYEIESANKEDVTLLSGIKESLSDIARGGKYFTHDVFNEIFSIINDNINNIDEKSMQQKLLNSENPLIAKITGDVLLFEEDKLKKELKAYPYEGKDEEFKKQHDEEVKQIFYNNVVNNVSEVVNEYKALIIKDLLKQSEKDLIEAYKQNDFQKAELINSDIKRYQEILSYFFHSEEK